MACNLYGLSTPREQLLSLIKSCNNAPGKYITEKLEETDKRECKVLDQKVVIIFFTYLHKEIDALGQDGWKKIPLPQWKEMNQELRKFIDESKEMSVEGKKKLTEMLVSNVQVYQDQVDPLTDIERLVDKYEKCGKLTRQEIGCLEVGIRQIAIDRLDFCMICFSTFAELQRVLCQDEVEFSGITITSKAAQVPNKLIVTFLFDGDFTAEEFAISLRMSRVCADMELWRSEIVAILQEVSGTNHGLERILRLWLLCIVRYESSSCYVNLKNMYGEELSRFDAYVSANKQRIFQSDERRELLDFLMGILSSMNRVLSLDVARTTLTHLEETQNNILAILSKHHKAAAIMDPLYEKLYTILSALVPKHKMVAQQKKLALLGDHLPSPTEFAAMKFPQISVNEFTDCLKKETLESLQEVGIRDGGFCLRLLLRHLFGLDIPRGVIDVVRLFCRKNGLAVPSDRKKKEPVCAIGKTTSETIDVVADKVSQLQLEQQTANILQPQSKQPKRITAQVKQADATHSDSPALQKESGKGEDISSDSNSNTLPAQSLPQPAEKPQRTVSKQTMTRINGVRDEIIFCALRVRDWMQQNPRILEEEPYKNRSASENEDSKFFHTYPMLVTKVLRRFVKPEEWLSAKTGEKNGKMNSIYSASGTIERYDKGLPAVEGYFVDCFDRSTNELYHHFFHRMSFTAQLNSNTAIISPEARQAMLADREEHGQDKVVAEQEVHDRFQLVYRRYTVEVDDTLKKVRYTICLPNGIK